jgi:vacuolar-type H+-ATPase catalytic subunit A/Vma1
VFGEDLEQALKGAVTVTAPSMDANGEISDGVLSNFTILSPEYVIKEDGSSKPLSFSTHQLQSRYGKPVNESVESLAAEVVDGFFEILKTNEHRTDIPTQFINELMSDSRLMAFYISAMTYGEYTLEDIYSDVARRFHNSKK